MRDAVSTSTVHFGGSRLLLSSQLLLQSIGVLTVLTHVVLDSNVSTISTVALRGAQ